MRRILLLAIFCAGTLSTFGQTQFREGKFLEILAQAKAEGKLVFVDCFTDWCPPCKHMDELVFPQPQVGRYLNNTFVCARFDMEKGEGFAVAMRYDVKKYPTFLILDGDGTLIGKMIGGSPPREFVEQIATLVENGGY